ncbi:hypothetical protein ACOME3_002772 [Neoechinorhynchus agilis]
MVRSDRRHLLSTLVQEPLLFKRDDFMVVFIFSKLAFLRGKIIKRCWPAKRSYILRTALLMSFDVFDQSCRSVHLTLCSWDFSITNVYFCLPLNLDFNVRLSK